MFKKICIIFPVILCLISVIRGYAEETLTITTYYPSPYGSYYELRAYKLAVGNPNDALFGGRFVTFADQMGLGEILAAKAFNISGRYYATRIAEKVISADNRSGTDIMSDLSVNILLDADANSSSTASFRILNATADSSDSSKELFRVNATGNVGIGTANPPAYNKLTVNGGWLQVTGAGATSWGDDTTRIGVYDTDNTGGVTGWWFSQNNDGKFAIHQNAVSDRLIIDGSGNVGIGAATPNSKLSIGQNGANDREYLKIDMESGTPPASECNEQPEGGRMIYDDGNHVTWVCDGAGGWKKVGGAWPEGHYCIIQAQNQPCPTGFTTTRPGYNTNSGWEFILGAGRPLQPNQIQSTTGTYRVDGGDYGYANIQGQVWAFCCK